MDDIDKTLQIIFAHAFYATYERRHDFTNDRVLATAFRAWLQVKINNSELDDEFKRTAVLFILDQPTERLLKNYRTMERIAKAMIAGGK